MREVRGCFFSGGDRKSNLIHSKEEGKASIDKTKSSHPKAPLTKEDFSAVVNMTISYEEEGDDEEPR